jgi:hypothetical protein
VTIGDIFEFNSEIVCNLKLSSIEEIFFEKLKNKFDPEKSLNKMKFEEMKELSFEGFLNAKKFEEEVLKLKNITRKSRI